MIYNSIAKLNPNLEATAASLGISRLRLTLDIFLPQTRTTLVEMFSYFFVNSMMTISAVAFLADLKTKPIALLIPQFEAQMLLEASAFVSLLILAVNLLMKGAVYLIKRLSARRTEKAARSAAEDIQNRGLVPLVVGGTGLYVDALTGRLSFDDDASSDLQYRSELNALCEERGAEFVHNVLKNVDKASADAIHPNNIKRVIRALEYYHVTGQTISAHNEETKNKEPLYLTSKIGFTRSRENLYARIDKRVDIMLKQGLLDETRRLLDMGCTDANTSMQALGYREAAQYLKGGMSYDEMAELIKRNSRRYAKRQLTWFKRDEEIHWLNLDETDGEKLAQICIDIINKDLKRSTR